MVGWLFDAEVHNHARHTINKQQQQQQCRVVIGPQKPVPGCVAPFRVERKNHAADDCEALCWMNSYGLSRLRINWCKLSFIIVAKFEYICPLPVPPSRVRDGVLLCTVVDAPYPTLHVYTVSYFWPVVRSKEFCRVIMEQS